MKKRVLFAILTIFVLGILMTACSNQGTVQPTSQATNTETVVPPIPAATNTSAETGGRAATSECRTAPNALENLKATMDNPEQIMKTALSMNSYLDTKVGDCVIFPYAIRNELLTDQQFTVSIEFNSAKDRSPIANPLTADKDVMNSWTSETDTRARLLKPHEYVIIPIKIRVGDMRTKADSTLPGTYSFTITTTYKTGDVSSKSYDVKKDIFVRVLQ